MIKEKELELLKENLDKMSRSEEQFIFMIFKNIDGSDNISAYGFNMPKEKLKHYLKQELSRVEFKGEKDGVENNKETN